MAFLKSDIPQLYGEQAGEGEVQVGRQKQRRAKKKISPTEELKIEEIGELSMPKETENKLVKLFTHWTTKFSALNAELDLVLAESKADREQIDKNMQERRKIFEAGLHQ